MIKKYFSLFALLCVFIAYAQTSVTVAVTHAYCTGQGSAVATANNFDNPVFQFKDSTGAIIGSGGNSSSVSSLDAGNYSVSVSGDGGTTGSANFTIENRYTPIPTPIIAINGLCDNTFTTGGSITVTMPPVSGKSYEYKVVKDSNANFLDSMGTYIPLSTSTDITSFGIYQIRIKDECGATVTITRNIQPSLSAITSFYMEAWNNQACGSGTFQIKNLGFITANGTRVSVSEYAALGGIRVEMWENTGSGCPASVPSSSPIYQNVFQSHDPTGPTDSSFVIPVVASGRYIIRVTTPCGESNIMCENLNYTTTPRMDAVATNAGCGSSERMTISGKDNSFLNFPVSVTVTNSIGTVVHTYNATTEWWLNNWSVANLPLDTYIVTYTDECSNVLTKTLTNPVLNTDPITLQVLTSKNKCKREDPLAGLTVTGSTQVTVVFSGYVPNAANAVVRITSGPSNVGVVGVRDIDTTGYLWDNMLPGDYEVQIDTLCDGIKTFNFTVGSNDPNILRQSIVSSAVSYCSGGGTISSTVVYNGLYPATVQLLNSAGTVIASSNTGSFNNIPAGTYNTRLRIVPYCGPGTTTYYINNANPIVLSDAVTGAQVNKKIGVICEDATGTPTTKGSAYFEISGALPITVEYRVKGSGSAYTSMTVNSLNFEINNLDANVTYEIQLTSCGNTNTTEVIIQSPGAVTATNTVQPCLNNPYTLSLPDYAGATYSWRNPAGVEIATTRNFTIANYTAANDGVYQGTVSWGSCVVRYVNLTLNSTLCGGPIGSCGTIDSDGDGVFDGCDLDDDNDGILDTEECSNTIMDLFAVYSTGNLTGILPADFGLTTGQVNQNVSADLSAKFGYPANSGAIIISITNGSVNPNPTTPFWWTKAGQQPTVWNISGTMSAFVLMSHDFNYYANDSKTIHIYDQAPVIPITFPAEMANQTPVAGQWGVTETPSAKTLSNLSSANPSEPKPANWRYANMNFGPKSFGFSTTVAQANPAYEVHIYLECDTDKDGIPNRLDLDSDNDGCVDAIEGGGTITASQVVTASGTVTVGSGSTAANQNLGTTVDTNGVPTIINGGQTVGDSQNLLINGCFCYQPPTTTGTALPTKHGITSLGRGGDKTTEWPQIRKGAWTVLESKTKGFVINRIATTALVQAIPNPIVGMMVYDEQADCLKINTTGTSTGWSCFNTQTCP